MTFTDRTEAGRLLSDKLVEYFCKRPRPDNSSLLVVGLPRGGVPVALQVARRLGCPLEIIVAKKLPFPGQPEYAIGAVTSDGVVVLNQDIPQDGQWSAYIDQQRSRLLAQTIKSERQFYELAGYKPSSFKGKTVILVDDGIATGMTAIAAAESARRRGSTRIIIAAPVISPETFRELSTHCDDIVAVSTPPQFRAVGQYYYDFNQTSDQEVVQALREGAQLVNYSESHRQEPGANLFGR